MIIRFDNLDDVNYSGQYVFDQNGFHHANYDYTSIDEFIDDVDTIPLSQRDKIAFGFLPWKPFAYVAVGSGFSLWTSYKYTVTYDSGYYIIKNCVSIDSSDCEDLGALNDFSYSGFVNCWTSGKVYVEEYHDTSESSYESFFKYRDSDCYNLFPVLGFKNSINYPKFRIYAKDFGNIPNFNFKFNLFLHIFHFDDLRRKLIFDRTVKIGAFGSIDSKCFFENFYGERAFLDNVPKPIFDLTNFFNTVIFDSGSDIHLSDFLFDTKFEVPIYNINAFGNSFAFEIKEEVDFGTMSGLDCQCLTTAINSLNSTLEGLFKDSNEDSIADTVSDIKDCLLGGLNGVSNSSNLGSVFMSTKCNRKFADSFDYVFTDINCDSLIGNFITTFNNKGNSCNNALYFKQCDNDNIGSSCNKPLYLNVCDLPALKFNDLFNRIDIVGALDVNVLSQPFDYASVLSSIVTALGNLLKPSDTVNVAVSSVPNVSVSSFPNVVIDSTNPIDIDLGFGSDCNNPLNVNLCPFTLSEVPIRINSIPSLTGAFGIDIDTMPGTFNVNHLNDAVDISCICDELDDIDKGLVVEFGALGLALSNGLSGIASKFVTSCETTFGEAFSEAFNLTNCVGSVFKANDDVWNGEDTLSGIWYKQLDYDYNLISRDNKSSFLSFSSNRLLSFSSLIRNAFFDNSQAYQDHSVFNFYSSSSGALGLGKLFKRALFCINDAEVPHHFSSVFSLRNDPSDSFKILNHSCDVNPNSIKFCEFVSQPAIPIEISSPVEISQPEDEWGEPVPFKMDWKPLLDLLSEALFCQFGNDGLDPRASWGYSVFNKLLYPLHAEGCDDKVGLPELDFSEGFVPDNIFVNSNGLIARFNSEIYR